MEKERERERERRRKLNVLVIESLAISHCHHLLVSPRKPIKVKFKVKQTLSELHFEFDVCDFLGFTRGREKERKRERERERKREGLGMHAISSTIA